MKITTMSYIQLSLMIWILRLISGGMLLRALFAKLFAEPESVYIFSRLGIEPCGRLIDGVIELIAFILILVPGTTSLGSLMAAGTAGAELMIHFSLVGIVVQNDNGYSFLLALAVFVCSSLQLFINRKQLINYFLFH